MNSQIAICKICGKPNWTHRPEATFMRIWTCIESWRNKK